MLTDPSSYFSTAGRLLELQKQIEDSIILDDIDAVAVLKCLISHYGINTAASTAILDILLTRNPTACLHKVGNVLLLQQIEATLLILPQSASLKAFLVLAKGYTQNTALYPYLDDFKTRLFATASTKIEISVRTLFELPLKSLEICRISVLVRKNPTISPETAIAGLKTGPQWAQVCFEMIHQWNYEKVDDFGVAALQLELLKVLVLQKATLGSRGLLNRHPPEFRRCTLSSTVYRALVGFIKNGKLVQLSLPPLLDDLQTEIQGILAANAPHQDVEIASVFPEFQSTQELQEEIETRFASYGHREMMALIKRIEMLFPASASPSATNPEFPTAWRAIFEAMLKTESLLTAPDLRYAACCMMSRVLAFWQPNFTLQHDNVIGSWLIGCLRSTNRRLRIQATRCVGPFFAAKLKQQQRFSQFRFISNWSPNIQPETCLMIWAEAAVHGTNSEHLNVLLLHMLDVLGTSKPFISALAFHTLQQVARRRRATPWKLCMPFWDTISTWAVRKLNTSEDGTVWRFCQLLGVTVDDLLVRTAEYTVPQMAFKKRGDVLQLIANAKCQSASTLLLDYQDEITVKLMTEASGDFETFVYKRWADFGPNFTESFVNDNIMKPTATKLFLLLSKAPDRSRADAAEKEKQLLDIICYVTGDGPDTALSAPVISKVIHRFSGTMHNVFGTTLVKNRKECLRGLDFLIRHSHSRFLSMITPINTLILSALEWPNEPKTLALSVWRTMLECMTDRRRVIDLVYSVLSQMWSSLDEEAQEEALRVFNTINDSPDTASYGEEFGVPMVPFYSNTRLYSEQKHETTILKELVARTEKENVYVVRQAVEEIVQFVHENQNSLHMSLFYPQGVERVQTAIRALVDLSRRFPDPSTGITTPCIQALCFLGALDPSMVDIQRVDQQLVIVSNFDESEECREFAAYFAVNYLLKMAEASTNPMEQNFLLYGIQDTLKFCGLRAEDADTPQFKSTWRRLFGSHLDEQLMPFLHTRYLSNHSRLSQAKYPIFNRYIEYSTWVGQFCYDLMCRTHGVNVDELFGLYRRIFVEQVHTNPEVFEFLLPYVALHAVLNSRENQEILEIEMRAVMGNVNHEISNAQFTERMFAVFDYFAKWRQAKRQQTLSAADQRALAVINSLENQISLSQLAVCAKQLGAYARELRYHDQIVRASGIDLDKQKHYEDMRRDYAMLEDPDALEGIASLKSEISFEQQIELYESKGDWSAALACYDAGPSDVVHKEGRLRCLQRVGRNEEVLALLESDPWSVEQLAVAAALETLSTEGLDKAVRMFRANRKNAPLEGYFGEVFLALRDQDYDLCMKSLEAGISAAGVRLNNTDVTSLTKIRSISLYLHVASDISQIAAWKRDGIMPPPRQMSEFNDQRLLPLGDDLEARRYVLSIRRAAYFFADFPQSQISNSYLEIARDYRRGGQLNMALSNIWLARQYGPESKAWMRQMAKLLWQQGERQRAISLLETCVSGVFATKSKTESQMKLKGDDLKLALLYITWLDQSRQMIANDLYTKYMRIVKEQSGWEKALYEFYKFYDRVYQSQLQLPEDQRSRDFYVGKWESKMISLCVKTLVAGSKYFGEVLPRLLTLWLDFGEGLGEYQSALERDNLRGCSEERQRTFKTISAMISKRAKDIDPLILYHGLPQLMSRITSVNEHTFSVVLQIVMQVIIAYPEHAFWMIAESTQSNVAERKRRGEKIVKGLLEKGGTRVREIIPSAMMTVRRLKDLALYQRANGKQRLPPTIQLSQIEFDTSWLPSLLVVPVHKILSCDAMYTRRIAKLRGGAKLKLLGFSGKVTMYKMENTVAIQPSLQQPKRVTVWGSDGKLYNLLCKGQDDVRKDARLIELSVTVNRLLDGDRDAAKRHLRIEPYRVIPLSADSGIIEWVSGAVPQRTIIEGNLRSRGIKLDMKQVGTLLSHNLSPERRMKNFVSLTEKYPPVLYEWFLYTFSDPEAWYNARTLYARSAAVMSMVGYILGLGDRHNENLLILQSSGAQMHVDFECLFDKGLSLTVPERVPFRLTRNMVDAFGVYGYEGPFRRTSELVLGVLRSHEELVMTVLETFLYDPVVMRSDDSGPKQTLAVVRDKLRGIRFIDSPALSVPGHVENLIQHATSLENLSLMYCGWAAFL